MKKIILCCLISFPIWSQADSTRFTFQSYVESYIGHSFFLPKNVEKSTIFYNHTRYNQPAVNMALFAISLEKAKWKVEADIMLGTYAQKNLSKEPGLLKYIHQLKLTYQKNEKQFYEVGILPSYIGYESAKNWENPSFSRSYIAENSPYYLTGISWNFIPNSSLQYQMIITSGWQHMSSLKPALGTRIFKKLQHDWQINSSTFLGNEGNGTRIFFNTYLQKSFGNQWKLVFCQDVGIEKGKTWHGNAIFVTYSPFPQLKLTGRIESYNDPNGIIISSTFSDFAQSFNVDVRLLKKFMIRSEFKHANQFGNEILFGLLFNQ